MQQTNTSGDGSAEHGTLARRYFEDFPEGTTIDLGTATVSAEEIVAFARQFDPQPFHLDEARGRQSIYGGLIASGWHTMGLFMRLYVDQVLAHSSSMGSPGVDQIRWLKPVRPGDTLRCVWTVLSATPSRSKPDRGAIRSKAEIFNQRDELVAAMEAVNIFGRRPASNPAQ
jgi:acyl dehydratase